jgi:methylmalonyl-CoA mutase C-terminal domain/subunit
MTRMDCDGHDRGARYVARKMLDSGMEVVFTSFSVPEEVVHTAIQEDVDLIGLSFLTGAHLVIVPEIMRIMDEQTPERIPVLAGGIIPPQDIPTLKQAGILEVFSSGSSVDEIVAFVRENVRKR